MSFSSLRSSALIMLSLAAYASGVGQVVIHNNCNLKVYQSAVLGSTAITSGFTPAKDVRTYSYGPIADGLAIKFGYSTNDVIRHPLQFEVTRNWTLDGTDFLYYDISSLNGDPFIKRNRAVIPTDPNCESIRCKKGQKICKEGSYHKGQDPEYNPVRGCHADESLEVYLCSLGHKG